MGDLVVTSLLAAHPDPQRPGADVAVAPPRGEHLGEAVAVTADELFAAHLDLAERAVAMVCRGVSGPDLDDCHQDALVGLWQAAQRWDGRGSFDGWAVVRVRGAVIDGLRQRGGRPGRGWGSDRPLSLDHPAHTGEPQDPATGPERAVEARDELARVKAAVGSLSARQRDLVAGAVDGVPAAATARMWGVTGSAASRDLAIARRKLAAA